MKRFLALVLVVMMVLGMSAVAMAQDETAKLMGTWEAEFPEHGLFTIILGSNGAGEMMVDGESMGSFGYMMRDGVMVSAALEEDGEAEIEAVKLTIEDENTVVADEDGELTTFTRTAPADADGIHIDNVLIGTWQADLPEAEGMVMEYRTDGTYRYQGGEYEGENSYFVIGDLMVSMDDSGEFEPFRLAVVDEDNIDVTEPSTGVVARFVRAK